MESAAGSGPAEAKNADRRMSLGKYMKRMSSVFKKEKIAEKGSKGSATATATAVPTAPVAAAAEGDASGLAPKEEVRGGQAAPAVTR